VTNGTRAYVIGDGNSPWARRQRDLIALHLADLGGEERLSENRLSLLSSTVAGSEEKIRKFTGSIFQMSSILRQAAKNIQNDAPIGEFIAQQINTLATGFAEYSQWLGEAIQKSGGKNA
jgi:hypothetical protein